MPNDADQALLLNMMVPRRVITALNASPARFLAGEEGESLAQ
jgi:hypothetical protein